MASAFAGFTLKERIAVDPFGETFAAVGPGGRRARVRRLDPALAARKAFAQVLLSGGVKLATIEHPNVVATIAVGRDSAGALMVVTDDMNGPVALETVLRDARLSGASAGRGVALYVARAVASALSRAHRAGVVHGGVHPRSVWIDIDGEVRLADFAVARALATASSEDSSLHQGMLGYLAPELALGDPVSAQSDVYGAGALFHELVTGAPPPGIVDGPVPVIEVLERMLKTDPAQRFADGSDLSEALEAVAAQTGDAGVGRRELARFVAESRGAAEASLDAETEGFLADLAGGGQAAEEAPTRVETTPLPAPLPSHEVASGSYPALTDVVVSSLPLKPPEESVTRPVPSLPALEVVAESRDRDLTPTPVMERKEVAATVAPRPAAPQSPEIDPSLGLAPRGGGLGWIWAIAVVLALGALGVVLWQQKSSDAKIEETRQLAAKASRAAEESARQGDLVVGSEPAEAAVWLLLGRTPLDTRELDAARLHELRIEHEGYQLTDLVLAPAAWRGSGDAMSASVSATLNPAPAGYVAPAAPPETPAPTVGPKGRGRVHVESQPSGAQVWLLVGFTPEVRITSLPVGREHELKVVRDGYVPGFIVVKPAEWEGRNEVTVSTRLATRPSAPAIKP